MNLEGWPLFLRPRRIVTGQAGIFPDHRVMFLTRLPVDAMARQASDLLLAKDDDLNIHDRLQNHRFRVPVNFTEKRQS